MKKLMIVLLGALPLLAVADINSYENIKPVYFNINTGVSTGYSFTNSNNSQNNGAATNNYSLGANVGYNYNEYFASEIGYNHLWLGDTDTNPNGQVGLEDIALKGTIPLGDVVGLYGRIGVGGYQNVTGTDTNFANSIGVLYGAGAQWSLSRQWAFRAEYWSVTGLGQDIIQVGTQFSF